MFNFNDALIGAYCRIAKEIEEDFEIKFSNLLDNAINFSKEYVKQYPEYHNKNYLVSMEIQKIIKNLLIKKAEAAKEYNKIWHARPVIAHYI
jgi:hypothetical protein